MSQQVGVGVDGTAAADASQQAPQQESAVLKLKGLPYSVTKEQVLDFFSGYAVRDVAFVNEPDGRPSGLVRCCCSQALCNPPCSLLLCCSCYPRLGGAGQ
jgi:hypothetical protein